MFEGGQMSDPDNFRSNRPGRFDRLRRILSVPLTIVVLVYFLLEDLFHRWLTPLFRLLGQLAPFTALGRILRSLPPYAALVVFAIPFIIVEPIKVFSVFWIGVGHVVTGTLLLVASYVVSLFIVERLFHVTREQLLSIGWFDWSFRRIMRLRAWAFAQVENTRAWQMARSLGRGIAARSKAGLAWLRGRMQRA